MSNCPCDQSNTKCCADAAHGIKTRLCLRAYPLVKGFASGSRRLGDFTHASRTQLDGFRNILGLRGLITSTEHHNQQPAAFDVVHASAWTKVFSHFIRARFNRLYAPQLPNCAFLKRAAGRARVTPSRRPKNQASNSLVRRTVNIVYRNRPITVNHARGAKPLKLERAREGRLVAGTRQPSRPMIGRRSRPSRLQSQSTHRVANPPPQLRRALDRASACRSP